MHTRTTRRWRDGDVREAATPRRMAAGAETILRMQRTAGNQSVARAIAGVASRRMIQRVRVVRAHQLIDVPDDQVIATDHRVIRFSECSVRVQNPTRQAVGGDPSNPFGSRVTETQFRATKDDVGSTIRDFNNSGGNNVKLWNDGASALIYSGIRHDRHDSREPQVGLNHPDSQITIILPTPTVKHVSASTADATMPGGKVVTAYGLKGTISWEDRLFTNAAWIENCLRNTTVYGLPPGYAGFQLGNGSSIVIDLVR